MGLMGGNQRLVLAREGEGGGHGGVCFSATCWVAQGPRACVDCGAGCVCRDPVLARPHLRLCNTARTANAGSDEQGLPRCT